MFVCPVHLKCGTLSQEYVQLVRVDICPPDTSEVVPVLPSHILLQTRHQAAGDSQSCLSSGEDRVDPASEQDEVPAQRTGTVPHLEVTGQTLLSLCEGPGSVYETNSVPGQLSRSHRHSGLDDDVLPLEVDLSRWDTAVVQYGGPNVERPAQLLVILPTDLEAVDDQLAIDLFEVLPGPRGCWYQLCEAVKYLPGTGVSLLNLVSVTQQVQE